MCIGEQQQDLVLNEENTAVITSTYAQISPMMEHWIKSKRKGGKGGKKNDNFT